MSVLSTKNSMSVLVGNSVTGIAIAAPIQITDPTTAGTYIADGQCIMLDENDIPMTVATSTVVFNPKVRFVVRNGSNLNFSARIFGKDIVACTGVNYSAMVQQISSVGYNGTSGSIDAAGQDFTLTLVGDWDDQFWSEQKQRTAFNYYSTVASQQSIATSFSTQINAQGFRATAAGTGPTVKAEMLSDATTQATGNAANIAVVNGSDVFTFSATQASTTANTIGGIIRIGAAATTTGPIYVITANNSTDSTLTAGTQVRVHTYYQGTSGTVSTRGTGWDSVSGATNFGIKLTGLALTWTKDFFKNKVVSFSTELKGFGSTTSGTSTVPSMGTGDGKTVSEFESFASGNEGALNRTVIPLPSGRSAAISTTNYNTIAIESQDSSITNTVAGNAKMRVQTFIFIPADASQDTILLSQLNPYLTSVDLPTISIT